MTKNSEGHFTGNIPVWNTSNHPTILTNATQRNGTEYQMPLETVVKLSIASVGIPCNIIVTLVSARIFRQSSRSHNILTLLLAIADILYLLSIIAVQRGIFGSVGFDGSLLHCCILTTILLFSGSSSSWLVALICCERFICVKWPIRMHLNRNKYKKWSAFVLIVMFVIFSHVEESNNTKRCLNVGTDDKHAITIQIFTISLYGLIPTIPVLFFNISIVRNLVKHNRNMEHCPDGITANNGLRTSNKNTSVTVTVLSVSLMFVLARSPYSILYMVDLIFKLVTDSYLFFNRSRVYFIIYVIDFLDHTWNLAVYICSSSIFRNELYNLIRCSK